LGVTFDIGWKQQKRTNYIAKQNSNKHNFVKKDEKRKTKKLE